MPQPAQVGVAVAVVDSPPGNTITPAAKSIAACRRIKKTARPDADPASGSRTNITVAAGLGVGGVPVAREVNS